MILRFKSPFKEFDEYDLFRKVILNLKQENNEIYSNWFDSLDEDKKKDFHKIFTTSIIILNHDKSIKTIPRKIIKIRRMGNDD